jgi:hypothetical protein
MRTYNKVQGFIDRTDSKAARFGFGVYNMWWSEKEQEYEVRGVYLFKGGKELPYPFQIHQLIEYHDVEPLDPLTKPEDKELIET